MSPHIAQSLCDKQQIWEEAGAFLMDNFGINMQNIVFLGIHNRVKMLVDQEWKRDDKKYVNCLLLHSTAMPLHILTELCPSVRPF